MDNQFRSVPDGEYTRTIYSLLRDQKYHEVTTNLFVSKIWLPPM